VKIPGTDNIQNPAQRVTQVVRWRQRLTAITAAVLLAGSVTAWNVRGADKVVPASAPAAVAPAPPSAAARTLGTGQDSYAAVVETVAPAVVTIRSEMRVRAAQQSPFEDDPFFRRFFGQRGPRMPQERRAGALGSGVIVHSDGDILTNEHVVERADVVTVELTDGRSFKAKVVGSDPPSDLALLKIEAHNLPALRLGNSDAVRVGDVVLAVGNPMGLGQTVTMGIISAKGRATGLGDGSFEDFLQTDAPINQGNSGGALVNTRGELVGINSQILSPSGGNIGIGFAIPANMAQSVMHSLITDGRVHRGMLGVTVQSINDDLARSLKLETVRGALVSGVEPNGPAAKVGVQRGDVITAINGTPVTNSNGLRNTVAGLKPGSAVKLTVVRGGREETMSATLDELPSKRGERADADDSSTKEGVGLSVQPVTPDLARRLGLDNAQGLVVTDVDPAGPAAEAGFQPGDVIQEVNGKAVQSAPELRSALAHAQDRPALVLVQRENATVYLTLSPRQS
jgi:serine protease Do